MRSSSKPELISGYGLPSIKKALLVLNDESESPKKINLNRERGGYFSGFVEGVQPGTHYRFLLGQNDSLFADPASRYQPLGVKGPSAVVNPHHSWTDDNWPGIELEGQIIYEVHIGTFTHEGTFEAAIHRLDHLVELGITVIELMPLNEFPGHFGWGYDGIFLFAPYHSYGSVADVKSFIDHAHRLGIAVILDVVYNHFGPEGNHFAEFSTEYFNAKETTDWGEAINFDHPSSREYFVTNAKYWIEEFHFDGLRIDATPWFFCESSPHIFTVLTETIKNAHPKHKKRIIIGESES